MLLPLVALLLMLSSYSCCSAFMPPVPGRVQQKHRIKLPSAERRPTSLALQTGFTLLRLLPEAAARDLVAAAASPAADAGGGEVAAVVVSGLDDSTTIFIFLVGLLPFAVATVEFWRRIRFGEAFGTGKDSSVVFTSIGEDDAPLSSRGTRVLGRGALITAVILFAVAAAVIGLAVVSVVTSPEIPTSY